MRYVVPGLLGVCLSAAVILFGAVELHYAVYVYALAALLAVIWAGRLLFSETALWKPSPMHWPVLGFIVYAFIHYFLSPYEYLSRMELLQVCLYGFIYFFAANNINRGRDRTIVLSILLVLGTLEAMYGIWQGYTKSEAVLHLTRSSGFNTRASGTYVCPNHLAGLLEMIFGFALARLALYRLPERDSIEAQVLHKVTLAYAVVVMLAGILFTLSRAGWVSTIAGLMVFLVWGGVKTRNILRRVGAGVAALAILGLLMVTVPKTKYYLQLTLSPESSFALRDSSFNSRTLLWVPTWEIIKDNPIFGTGIGTWQWVHQKYRDPKIQLTAEHAHNDILQMISEYGVVGFVLVVGALGLFFWQARRLTREGVTSEQRCFAIGAAFAISILVVHSWFDFNLHIPANGLLFCAILGLVAGMEVPEGPYSPRPLKPLSRYLLVFVLLLGVAAGLYYIIPAARATRLTGIADQEKRYLYWDDAIGHYNAAIKLDPRYPRPWTKLGDVYYTQAKFRGDDKKEERVELARKAAKHYETAFELNRSRGAVLAKLAGAYEVTEEFDKARRCFEKAIELDSNNATIHSQYGLFLRRRGEDKEAIQTFEKVRKLYANPISELNLWELQGNTL